MNLADSWEAQSEHWIRWARPPGFDSYWRYHRDQFLELLPPPNRRTVDVGCGEGRLTRHLKELGHQIVGVDASPSLVAAARELDPSTDIRLADDMKATARSAVPSSNGSAGCAANTALSRPTFWRWKRRDSSSRRCANRAFPSMRLIRKRAAGGSACRSFCMCAPAVHKPEGRMDRDLKFN
jgi:SAM-dependent methyltransferase